MTELPNGLSNDDRCVGINLTKNIQTVSLTVDESVTVFADVMRPFNFEAESIDRSGKFLFHRLLRWPAHSIGRQSRVTAGDEKDGAVFGNHD